MLKLFPKGGVSPWRSLCLSMDVHGGRKDFKPSSAMDLSSLVQNQEQLSQFQRPDIAKEEKMRAAYRKVGRTKGIMESEKAQTARKRFPDVTGPKLDLVRNRSRGDGKNMSTSISIKMQ